LAKLPISDTAMARMPASGPSPKARMKISARISVSKARITS
jgi:hypothetical protein